MSSFSIQSILPKRKAARRKSVSYKISISVLAVLIPLLAVLIITSCLTASHSISLLNRKTIDVQAEYAVSIVDNFFSSKVTAVSMFEENTTLQAYFKAISKPQDIETYDDRGKVQNELSGALKRMSEEKVVQAWVADDRTDKYLLSNGKIVNAGLKKTVWHEPVLSGKKPVVSEPYLDPATGQKIVSIVSPVISGTGNNVAGFVGFDVYVSTLADLLSEIAVGENGYLELLSNSSDYIYSNDPKASGKNVSELDIAADYKNKVQSNYNGAFDFTYKGTDFTSVFQNSQATGWLAITTLPISEVNATRNHLIALLAGISIVILAVLICIIVFVIRRMMKPLAEISNNMEEFGQGNLEVEIKTQNDDEIGRLADSVRLSVSSLKEMIQEISHILGELSNGNLNTGVKGNYIGDFRFIRDALEQIIRSLNRTLGQINTSAEQVTCGSEQVSASAQALAQGAAEQAGTVEELAVNIGEISQQINANADSAENANQRAYTVGTEAAESNRRMQEMVAAMHEISNRSHEIDKIVKTIKDIAFQTNILALNAAVEAARAGESGRGFSVVAGEVRNLASKSSEASKNTAVLIKNSLKTIESGTRIADETAESLNQVVGGVNDIVKTIDSISAASNEQARSVEQVKQGVEQISNVIQVNSATAEETAAASEELSAQALRLKELIGNFQLKEDNALIEGK